MGNRRTVSTSNTRNRTERIKKYREKGDREPFKRSSNPHSMGLALSVASLEIGGVSPNTRIRDIRITLREEATIKISQNI